MNILFSGTFSRSSNASPSSFSSDQSVTKPIVSPLPGRGRPSDKPHDAEGDYFGPPKAHVVEQEVIPMSLSDKARAKVLEHWN